MFADDVEGHIEKSLKETLAKILTLKDFKVVAYGPMDSRSESWDGGYYDNLHYWAQVEYPTSVTLRYKVRLSLIKRWNEALAAHQKQTNGQKAELTREVLDHFSDMILESTYFGEYLSEEAQEKVWDALSDGRRGVQTEAQMSESHRDGEDEEHVESPSVDARFHFAVDQDNAKVEVVLQPATGELVLDFKVPVEIQLRKIVSPWDGDYQGM
jgi:hypothetical protein